MENLVLLHFLDIFMTVLRIFLHLPELYFSHTEQPVNKKSGGTKMMNRLFKRGMVIALAAAMTTSAGIPAMAAQKETLEETLEETVTTSEVTQTNVDYGSLTQKEIEEFNSIYDRLDAIDKEVMKDADGLSDEDIYARYDQYQDETDTLMDRLEELDKKAGWIDNEEYEYSEDEYNDLYDTGKLTAEEAEQLQKAYERIEEIDAEVWTDDDLSDDEIEARYAKYDDEITSLNAQIETLEEKAGWYEGYYGNLSEDEVNQLNSIYNKIDAIYDNIYNLSEEEFASRYAKYSDEIDALEAQAIALEAKAGGTKIQTY